MKTKLIACLTLIFIAATTNCFAQAKKANILVIMQQLSNSGKGSD